MLLEGRSRPGEDAAGQGPRPAVRRRLPADPVHSGPHAGRYSGHGGLSACIADVPVAPRARLHHDPAGRRDQPGPAQDAGRAAGGHGGTPRSRWAPRRIRCRRSSPCWRRRTRIEYEGTYPLPEAQVDRFMCKILLRYPSAEEELAILSAYDQGHDLHRAAQSELTPVTNPEEVLSTRRELIGHQDQSGGDAISERGGPRDPDVSADPGGGQPEGRGPPAPGEQDHGRRWTGANS